MAKKVQFVRSLTELEPADCATCGGKAVRLGALRRAGFPVPPGFCLTVGAYRRFLRANRLVRVLRHILTATDLSPTERAGQAHKRIGEGTWPSDLKATVLAAYHQLVGESGVAAVAVRSSAPLEDGADLSFAGQHLTVLPVADEPALLEAIRRVWASSFSEAALTYRKRMGITGEPLIAVVVQSFIPAEASGVAFSRDPTGGDADRILIDAVWGLGETAVNGLVTPDHYVVEKTSCRILAITTGEKRVEMVPDLRGTGVVQRLVPPSRSSARVLSDTHIAALARLVIAAEQQAGQPQDIEWALARDRFYLLQSRPITTASERAITLPPPPPASWVSEFDTETDPDTVWTAANIQEALPGQISPLTWSLSRSALNYAFARPARRVGIAVPPDLQFVGLFYGRAFLNVSALRFLAEHTLGLSAEAIEEQYLGKPRQPGDGPRLPDWHELRRSFHLLPRYLQTVLQTPTEARAWERLLADLGERDAQIDVTALSPGQLLAEMERALPWGPELAALHIGVTSAASVCFELLGAITRHWLQDDGRLQAQLVSGLSNLDSAQPAHELWALARELHAAPELCRLFETYPAAEVLARLRSAGSPAAHRFLAGYDRFLHHHGHRSVRELELAAPSWAEDPETVIALIRNYLHAGPESDPQRIEARQQAVRRRAEAECLRRLSPLHRLPFKAILAYTRRYIALREHTKSLLVRGTARGRRYLRELGRRLVRQGRLAAPDDLFYLTWEEITALVRGASEDMRPRILRRRAEEERNRRVLLPESFSGRPLPLQTRPKRPIGGQLRGIAVSPGRYTGPARVVLDPRRSPEIQAGDVLVAPVTDAGWTPLFIAAGALVVDVGGPLSHGSTVAREYGLPAVVNVKEGTRRIRTGQRITVDGDRGIVYIENDSADACT